MVATAAGLSRRALTDVLLPSSAIRRHRIRVALHRVGNVCHSGASRVDGEIDPESIRCAASIAERPSRVGPGDRSHRGSVKGVLHQLWRSGGIRRHAADEHHRVVGIEGRPCAWRHGASLVMVRVRKVGESSCICKLGRCREPQPKLKLPFDLYVESRSQRGEGLQIVEKE